MPNTLPGKKKKKKKHKNAWIAFMNSVLSLKKYFVTMFSAISFQFLANKRFPNRP